MGKARKLERAKMTETVRLSFEGAQEDTSPFVTVYDPGLLTHALFSQMMRFGLSNSADKNSASGKLKGTRKAFTEMIHTYGYRIRVVSAPKH
jgi:hypothetical protein